MDGVFLDPMIVGKIGTTNSEYIQEGKTIIVKDGKSKTKLNSADSIDYITPDVEGDISYLDAKELYEAIDKTISFAPKSAMSPVMCGIHFNKDGFIEATDSFFASIYKINLGVTDSFTLPLKSMTFLKSMIRGYDGMVELIYNQGKAMFVAGIHTVVIPCIQFQYPNLHSLVRETDKNVNVYNTKEIQEMILKCKALNGLNVLLKGKSLNADGDYGEFNAELKGREADNPVEHHIRIQQLLACLPYFGETIKVGDDGPLTHLFLRASDKHTCLLSAIKK